MKTNHFHQETDTCSMIVEQETERDPCHSSCCGCGCERTEQHLLLAFCWPILSFCLLVIGILMNYMQTEWFVQSASVGLIWYLVAFLPVGLPVMHKAWAAMQGKDYFSEFSLMVIASIGAFCIGEYPEAVAVMLFYTIGETFQHLAVDRASHNIEQLLDVRPEQASVWRNDAYVTVSPKEVGIGEQIEIKPGERVPLDGTLVEKEAMFDTSALTGESLPRLLVKDENVLAGMIALGQSVHLVVSRPYEQSALARILSLVKDAATRKAPTELFIRRFARVYTPIVMVLALFIVFVPALIGLWWSSFDYVFSDWLYRGLVFLVISCPCALVISVPLGYFAGIGVASRMGILFKGGNYLDAIAYVNNIAFDKTGTLTTGRFEVMNIICDRMTEETLLRLMASVEQKSTHPIAKAIVDYAGRRSITLAKITDMHEVSGHGVEAEVESQHVVVGNVSLLKEQGIDVPEHLIGQLATTIVCAVDGQYVGALFLTDVLKPDAVSAINHLKMLGVDNIYLLSGDRQTIVDKYARDLGIQQAYGELLPEDKATYVERIAQTSGQTVAFVGDGMNDAPVLALSQVGIAMGGLGSDAAIESADVVIQTDQPSKVAIAIRIGRSTHRIVRQNIIGAISIKVIILLAGSLGYASLWSAVFADVGVALLAVCNSVRILGQRYE